MIEYLADKDVDVHPVDPIFITWDRTLFDILKVFFNFRPNSQRWMQFTPSQFIDKYSLLSFSINETTISKEMLAMLSGELVSQTHSLLDSLALIINPDNEVGLAYTNRFIEMKDSYIFTTDKGSDEPRDDNPHVILDNVIYKITAHYQENLNGLKLLLSDESKIDDVMIIISDACKYEQSNKSFDNEVYCRLDTLIKSIAETGLINKNNTI